jgi:hypothetical protein
MGRGFTSSSGDSQMREAILIKAPGGKSLLGMRILGMVGRCA